VAHYPWLLESSTDAAPKFALLENDPGDASQPLLLEKVNLPSPIGNRPFTMKTSTQKLEPQRRHPRLTAIMRLTRRV